MPKSVFFALVVAVMGASCGSEEEAKGQYGEACSVSTDCVEGLSCLGGGFCTSACVGSDTTACLATGTGSVCLSGTCYATCNGGPDDCVLGLRCSMAGSAMMTCRL